MKNAQEKRYCYGVVLSLLLNAGLVTAVGPALGTTQSKSECPQRLRISVRVCDYAQVSNKIVARAERDAGDIFRAVGVDVAWINCRLPGDPQCADLDTPHLIVRLLPDIGTALSLSNRAMGFALGDQASVSLRRAREDAAEFGVHLHDVLGHVLAHEIGHLLLVSQGHSPSGIMRAQWQREDFERGPVSAFRFTSDQAQSIRSEVRRRIQE